MGIKTLVVAPYAGLKELATQLAREQKALDVSVFQGDLKEAIPIIKQYQKKDIEFIVSRGGTAKLIRQQTALPVIEIPVSGYDILRSLILVKDYKMRLELIGFANICQGVISVAHLLDIEIPYTIIDSEDEVDNTIREALARGVKVVLGDTVTVNTAEKFGLQGMLITSGKESVLDAFHQVQQMHEITNQFNKKNKFYEHLMNHMSDGVVVFNEAGIVSFHNKSFLDLFGFAGELITNSSLSELIPEMSALIKQMILTNHSSDIDHLIEKNNKKMRVKGGQVVNHLKETHFYFIVKLDDSLINNDQAIQVSVTNETNVSFAHMVTNSHIMTDTVNKAKLAVSSRKPVIIIYGEKGTGKKFMASAIHKADSLNQGDFMEISISEGHNNAFHQLSKILMPPLNGTLYVKGIEYLSLENQKQVLQLMNNLNSRFILSFEQNPEDLAKSGLLHSDILNAGLDGMIRMPSLLERKEDFEECIGIFIAKYNMLYGKQVVGIRQNALNKLYEFEWPENIKQLKSTIKELVRIANGHYIEEESLHLLEASVDSTTKKSFPIDLSKTLDEIEKEVILHVLHEENMNQTSAAKRLGINRTTLWRKIK